LEERIKELRKSLGLNQTEFGNRIGVKQGTIAGYENGIRVPLDAVITSICREFHVSRAWLEFGEGPMYPPESDDDIKIITRAMEGQSEAKKRLMRFVAEMPDTLLEELVAYMEGKKN